MNKNRSGVQHRFKNLRTLLESICLRRTKDIVGILDPTEELRYLEFNSDERHEYDELQQRYDSIIDTHVSGHGKGVNTAKVQFLLRLRLFCNHGKFEDDSSFDRDGILSYLQQIDQAMCMCCSQPIYSVSSDPGIDGGLLLAGCLHLVCWDCVSQGIAKNNQCPQCSSCAQGSGTQSTMRVKPSSDEDQISIPGAMAASSNTYPTKLLAFLYDIERSIAQKR